MAKYKFHKADHLHTLDGKPLTGTSTVMEVVSKPLTWWASGEAVKTLGWTPSTVYQNDKPRKAEKEPRVASAEQAWNRISEDVNSSTEGRGERWLTWLDNAYKAHSTRMKKAATDGTNLHERLERYVKACIERGGKPIKGKGDGIQEFIDWSVKNIDKFLWSEMHTYSEEHWLGGITDAGAVMKDGKVAIIDFKSSKSAYQTQFWQIGGYSIQIEENGGFDSSGNKIMDPIEVDTHIVIPFGAPEFSPAVVHDIKGMNAQAFLAALTLYRAKALYE